MDIYLIVSKNSIPDGHGYPPVDSICIEGPAYRNKEDAESFLKENPRTFFYSILKMELK